ncbi:XRE family transcriptional regulator [Pseudomonas sp. LS-2]|uniref:LexA family transcriptional regulator n=1 Tax=Pseudomonas sp. LS-2 TaxID=2315859 RepID=UPI000E711FFA|nr:XRE family transcriptional regulator [Pseudomonas sp. LS-2]RJX81293.1 hypothetical protein D3M70_09115 [Pseudomonas sp. LS-2]
MNTSHSGQRLKELLRSTGRTPSQFAADFGISNQTLNNWFVRGVPGKGLLSVSKYFGVRPEWLESGTGEALVSGIDAHYSHLSESERADADRRYAEWAKQDHASLARREQESADRAFSEWAQYSNQRSDAINPPDTLMFDFPEISWAQAARGVESMDFGSLQSNTRHRSEVFAGPSGFWLPVVGSSMMTATGPSFPEGFLILVAPDVEPKPGQLIVARLINSHEATFKRLEHDAGVFFLKPLNPAYPIRTLDDDWEIIGTVVDGKIPRSVFG